MNAAEYRCWYRTFLDEGIRHGIPAGDTLENIQAWAHSMALIADEFDEDDGAELVDAD